MKFRIIGGPLTSSVSFEAKHTDTFKSILKKAQKAAGKKAPLGGYDFFTSVKSATNGELEPSVGPLKAADTPDTVKLARKQTDPHVLLLVKRDGAGDASTSNGPASLTSPLSRSVSTPSGDGDASSSAAGTSSASVSPMLTPRAIEEYRRRMQALFLKYDPANIGKVDLALERYAGYEGDVIKQLVKKYGPEPAAGEVDTSPAAVAQAVANAASESRSSASRARPTPKASYHDRLVAIYATYEPEKLSKVDGTLRRYTGREEEVIQQLVKKYGPEPPVAAATTAAAPLSAGDQTPSQSFTMLLTPMASSVVADSLPITPRLRQDDSTKETPLEASASATPRGPLTYRDRLTAMYAAYEPSKMRLVDGTLKKYKGREEDVIRQLVKMYGPEPSAETVAAAKEAAESASRARRASANGAPVAVTATAATLPPAAQASTSAALPPPVSPPAPVEAPATVELSPVAPLKAEEEEEAVPAALPAASAPDATVPAPAETSVPEARPPTPPSALSSPVVPSDAANASAPSFPVVPTAVEPSVMEEETAAPPSAPPPVPDGKAESTVVSTAPEEFTPAELPAEPPVVAAAAAKPAEEGGRYRERLVALYQTYNPNKLCTVEGTLRKFVRKEEAAIQQLVRRYGPEPPALTTEEALEILRNATGSPAVSPPSPASNPIPVSSPTAPTGAGEAAGETGSSGAGSAKPVSPVEEKTAAEAPHINEESESGYRERIHAILATHDPEKVDKVNQILERYRGNEKEVIAKLEQRYSIHRDEADQDDTSAGSSASSPTMDDVALPYIAAAEAPASAPPQIATAEPARPTTPLPEPVVAVVRSTPLVQATPPATAAPAPLDVPLVEPEAVAAETADHRESENDATRPTAPPSQRSSSAESSYNVADTPLKDKEAPAPPPAAGVPEAAATSAAHPEAKRETPPPPAVEHVATVAVPGMKPLAAPAPSSAPVAKAAPAPPAPTPLPVRPRNAAAIARVAATHLAETASQPLLQRYWSIWSRHHGRAKVTALLRDAWWIATPSPSSPSPASRPARGGSSTYRLNDNVVPAYTVSDLTVVVAQEAQGAANGRGAFSSELEIATRTLLASLRHCVESRVVEVRSAAEEELAEQFLAHWTVAEHLCPVRDSPQLARALHQAAHLIAQLDDLMTVIRTQAGQLQQLKSLHTDVLARMEHTQAEAGELDRLQAQLDNANEHRRQLQEELKRAATQTAGAGRSRSARAGRGGTDAGKTPRSIRPVYATAEERKDAQIAKLQQELAKTRNSLFHSKEAEEKMKAQVEHTLAREARREQSERRREGSPWRFTRPDSLSARSGDRDRGGARTTPRISATSPQRGGTSATTPRGGFSHAIAPDTPHRPTESAARIDYNGRAVSSIRRPGLEAPDQSNVSVSSNTPWPSSRYVTAAEVERGPCPNCLTPLTSCSPELRGRDSDKAAFCFSCRRSFTFGELHARDARAVVDDL